MNTPVTLRLAALATACLAPMPLAAQDTPDSTHAKQGVLWTRVGDSIRAIAQRTDGVIGVAVLDLTDQRAFHLNAEAVYPIASTIKIAVLAELYRQHERAATGGGGARLSDPYTLDSKDVVGGSGILGAMTPGITRLTNRDLAALMVSLSDNSATNILIDRVGMERVNAWLGEAGLAATRLRRRMMDVTAAREGRENTATARELAALLGALHGGKVFGQATADSFFSMLSLPKESYIPRFLPAGLRVANKPGWLDQVRRDARVVFVPGRPFAVAVLATFARDERDAELTIARIARAAWGYFDLVGRSSPLGRVVR